MISVLWVLLGMGLIGTVHDESAEFHADAASVHASYDDEDDAEFYDDEDDDEYFAEKEPHRTDAAIPAVGFVGGELSPLVQARKPWASLLLGATVGFGTGYYYAGETRTGLLFSLADGAGLFGLLVSAYFYNRLVAAEDVASGRRVHRQERDPTVNESILFGVSFGMLALNATSRVLQSIGGFRAAKRTNAFLEGVTVTPIAQPALGEQGALLGAKFGF